MARKTIDQYNRDAKRLKDRFPNLAKYTKRKRLKPYEKAQITRASNVARIMREPVAERPEKYKKYRFPAERHPPESFYRAGARKIAKYTDDPEKYKRLGKKGVKLSGGQKAAIRRKMDRLKFTENVVKLTPAQARKLPSYARLGEGLNAIKLRSTFNPKILSVKNGVITVRSSGRKWFYELVRPEQPELLMAGMDAFENGALQVYFWTVNGRVGGGAEDIEEFEFQLGQKYMQYLTETERQGNSTDWLLGIAWTKDKGSRKHGK